MKKLLAAYREKRSAIRDRLGDFSRVIEASDGDIFAELCFCLFTPQAKAVLCDEAIRKLKETGLLFRGDAADVVRVLKGKVRFQNNKACYCVNARKLFTEGGAINMKKLLSHSGPSEIREWLVKNVKGLGYKEASHFLRNIGLGKDLAILDVHILKNLKRYGVIKEIPKSLTKKKYFEIEDKLRGFAKKIKIPPEELDLLFWSLETGHIFK